METLLWIVVVFISILAHELGHALTSRKLAGGQPFIRLWGFGGLAYPNTTLTNLENRKVSFAGPAAGFGVTLLVIIFLAVSYGLENSITITKYYLFSIAPQSGDITEGLMKFFSTHWAMHSLINSLFWVNFWWSLVNLLPVSPLDGGRIYSTYEHSPRKIHQVGMVTAIIVALAFLLMGQLFAAALFGYLAYQNYQALQQYKNNWR